MEKHGLKTYTFEERYSEYAERFKDKSDDELVETLNKEVGVNASVVARYAYLFALRDELLRRGIDCSVIGDKGSVSVANRVKLNGKKLILEKVEK